MSLFLLLAAWPFEKKVTFEAVGTPASRLLPEISKQVGMSLRVSKSTEDDVLCVRLRDVPASEVMSRLASTLNASWKQVEGGYELFRSSDVNRDEQRKEHREQVARVRKMLQDSAETCLRAQPTRSGLQLMPVVLATLDPEELVGLPLELRTVYSSSPTASQRAMPLQMRRVCDQIIAANQSADEKQNIQANQWHDVGVVHLAVTRFTQDHWKARLMLYSRNGLHLGTAYGDIGSSFYLRPTARPVKETHPIPLELNEEDKALLTFPTRINSAIGNKILNPEQNEPLGLLPSHLLLQVASNKSKNLVAYLEDAFSLPGFMLGHKPTVESQLQFWRDTQLVKEDGAWMTLSPKMPFHSRQNRIGRKLLGNYLRTFAEQRPRTVESDATMARELEPYMQNALAMYWGEFLQLRNANSVWSRALRFYSAMSPSMRAAASRNEGVRLGSLSAEAYRQFGREIFDSTQRVTYRDPSKRANATNEDLKQFKLWETCDLYQDPTVFIPDGISESCVLHLREESEVTVTAVRPDGSRSRPFAAEELAGQIFREQHRDRFPSSQPPLDLEHLAISSRRIIHFEFTLRPDVFFSTLAGEDRLPTGAEIPFRQLPQVFLDKVNETLKIAGRNYDQSLESIKQTQKVIPPVPG